MKGKIKFSLKIMLTVAICLFAGVCFVGLQPIRAEKEMPAHAVATLDGREYSALLEGDVVLSVEKVDLNLGGQHVNPITSGRTFYGRGKEIYKYTTTVDNIKNDFNAGLPIYYIDGTNQEFVKVSDVAAIVDTETYYMANLEETNSPEDRFDDGAKLCFVKDGEYEKVNSLEDIQNNLSCKFYIIGEVGDIPYNFKDITENGVTKHVVEDGNFVMLNNKNEEDTTEGVIISIGQYVYFNNQITIAPQSMKNTTDTGKANINYAQITHLEVTLKHNGKTLETPIRDIVSTEGNFFKDFMFVITEDGSDIEGHYVLETTYMKGGLRYSTDFDFYLVCETTYTKTKTIDGQQYTSAPTLGWVENNSFSAKGVETDGYVHYYEGQNGLNKAAATGQASTISYPTITYDYTKYQLSYKHTANRNVTNYTLTYQYNNKSDVKMICSVEGSNSYEIPFVLTNYNENLKLVTVVFTEQGNYQFNFKYLYVGADSALAPTMDKLKIADKKLTIHGADLNYSKQDYTGAQFRKFNFATNSSSYVNLIVPNGYLQDETEANMQKFKNKALGFMYTTNSENLSIAGSKKIRVGEVIVSDNTVNDRTEDTLQNTKLSTKISGSSGYTTLSEVLRTYAENIVDIAEINGATNPANYSTLDLSVFEFIKSNQGSMWLSYTDAVEEIEDGGTIFDSGDSEPVQGSFYFYSRNEITEDSLVSKNTDGSIKGTAALPYNNQTSFNKVGYYLVFVKIKPNSIGAAYWQVYAFQYMSDTIDINVKTTGNADETKNNVDVGAGKYTKENVTVSWEEPGTFESKIVGKVYQYNNYNANRDQLLAQSATTLIKDENNKSQVLGTDVNSGNFAKYLVKLERAGKSATYKMFTIDRQPISGVQAFAIKTRATNDAVYYEYAYKGDRPIVINNGITNSFATLGWDKKASGAAITCKYSYTPIVANSSSPEMVNNSWITTKYELGDTVNNCDLQEVVSKTNVGYDSVLMTQGIYVFTITDEAGNATKYMLVIDNTEAYLQITDREERDGHTQSWADAEILENGSYKLYAANKVYRTGSHKAIKLDLVANDDTNKNEITDIINHITNPSLNLADYKDKNDIAFYTGDNGAWVNAMNALFAKYNTNNYLTVKNEKVVAYNNYVIDGNCSATSVPPIGKIVFDRNALQGATSLYRTLYIVGANTTYSASVVDARDSKSFVKIEINKDNALGMVYYSNDNFDVAKVPTDGSSKDNVNRLFTGSDYYENEELKYSGLGTQKEGARATKDKYVGFTWLKGEDKFTVAKLTYDLYELNFSKFDEQKYFYTTQIEDDKVLVDGGNPKDGVVVASDANGKQRGFFLFKTNYDNTTKAGLYVVTRYYRDDPDVVTGVDYGEDTYSLTYYFIVDRNGIHDVTNEIGNNIRIELLNEATKVSGYDLNTISTKSETFKYDADNDGLYISEKDIQESYFVYFKTNRVPAVIKVPTGKYFNAEGSSKGYYSGRLRVQVYYEDTKAQLNPDMPNAKYKIFEGSATEDNDYFTVDFVSYLINYESRTLVNKLIAYEEDQTNWLHLKGRYVVIIEDNIETSLKPNKKIIGFDIIDEQYPQAEIKIGSASNVEGNVDAEKLTQVVSNGINGQYNVVTNQGFVRVELPTFVENSELAQVDQQYIHVKQYFNNSAGFDYIKTEYNVPTTASGLSSYTDASGNTIKYVDLDTLLWENGNAKNRVLSENFDKPLYYTITIRYQIGVDAANPYIYKDCYVYYDYNKEIPETYFYETTYTIVIDRLAPTENVVRLRESDILVKNNKISAEFETDSYDSIGKFDFTYQYKDYYNNAKKLSDIYAFRVTNSTSFTKEEVRELYYINIPDVTNITLNLPFANNGFTKVNTLSAFNSQSTYGIFLPTTGYYQIIELDEAGNITQYVVYYTANTSETLRIPMKYNSTLGGSSNIDIGVDKNRETLNVYRIEAEGTESTPTGDYFFHISLKDNNDAAWQGLDFVTNFATIHVGDDSLANVIANKIGERKGNYELKIVSRAGQEYSLGLGLYSALDKTSLRILDMVEVKDEKYFIRLDGANVTTSTNVFYATKVEIIEKIEGIASQTYIYNCRIENGRYNYYDEHGVIVEDATFACSENNATYKLKVTDVFGDEDVYRFNTKGEEFYKIEFEDFKTYHQLEGENKYYTHANTTITFDETFTISYSDITLVINNVTHVTDEDVKKQYVEIVGNKVLVKKIFNPDTFEFGIVNVVLKFREADDGTLAEEYEITIDTTTSAVSLKNYAKDQSNLFKLYLNKNIYTNLQNLKEFKPETPTSGIMNLIWARDEKDIYKYSYQLFELKKDANETSGIVKEIILGESSTYVIDTQEDSLGVYWFVINILSPNGTLLGNKIYAFEVAGNNNNLYYVKQNGLAISANSMFKKNDIVDYNFKFGSSTGTDDNTIKTKIPNTSLALYISNSDLEVVKTEDVTLSKWVDETDSVTIYEVDAITYKVYFGILKVSATSQLIGNAKIVKNEMTDVEFGKNEFSTLVDKTNPTLNLTATRGISSTKMFEKNLLLLDIFYNDQKVKTVEYSGNINFAILGNGEYKFQVRDLAGNIHKFECAEEEVRVLILREVAVTINDEAPIENAYYNGEVSLKVYAATKYVTGSIEVKAERNGSEYQLSNSNPYIFKDYGTYVVKITGKFKSSDMELEQELTKTLTFSIINPDEVRTAIDLTNLKQHTITRVLNNKGNDITNEFLDMINNKTNAMLIRHEDVMERAIALKVSAGKLKFTIDYLVNDGIYPNREIQLQFTLNNEEPVIDCSLEIGETTKKEFSISFNPGIIFGQIGDCDICINGKSVYSITADSPAEKIEIVRSFKEHGAGDYYIQVVGTSGNVWKSFKVEIKEPLNASAIIVIVVVVAVVTTVVVTIIVLRRKMRIR